MSAVLGLYDEIRNDLESLRVEVVRASKIFYCIYGRNAWHSTWVQKYTNDCMHLTLDSAKKLAEARRVQGSVFTIKELPALVIEVGSHRIFVTQINSRCPLREYRHFDVDRFPGRTTRDCYLKVGEDLHTAVSSFVPWSKFWVVEQPPRNSIMLLYSSGEMRFEPLRTTPLVAWRSESDGPSYLLRWQRMASDVSGRSVLRIARHVGSRADSNRRSLSVTV